MDALYYIPYTTVGPDKLLLLKELFGVFFCSNLSKVWKKKGLEKPWYLFIQPQHKPVGGQSPCWCGGEPASEGLQECVRHSSPLCLLHFSVKRECGCIISFCTNETLWLKVLYFWIRASHNISCVPLCQSF